MPQNRILSHDLLEGCYIRTALISDTELLEECPATYLSEASRRHRWARGDWQIASWICGTVPSAKGEFISNPISFVSKWKIFDNLRRTFIPLAISTLLIYGWIMFPLSSSIPLLLTTFIIMTHLLDFIIGHIQCFLLKDEETSYFTLIKYLKISAFKRSKSLGL